MPFEGLRIPVLAALCFLLAACSSQDGAKGKPNVVLISIDNLGAEHMGCYGYAHNTSPFLDSLAKEGVLFEHVTAQETWTLPSHASLLSSTYVGVHGVYNVQYKLPQKNLALLQEAFGDQGYFTMAFITCDFLSSTFGFNRGFDSFTCKSISIKEINPEILHALSTRLREPFFLFIHYFDVHSPFGEPNPYGESYAKEFSFDLKKLLLIMHKLAHKKTKTPTQEEIAWVKGKFPFLDMNKLLSDDSFINTPMPQKELKKRIYNYFTGASKKELEPLKGLYDNGIAYVDKHLSDFFKSLKGFPWYEKTIFAITSDHGEAFCEHPGEFGHAKCLPFGEVVNIPLILNGNAIPRGKRINASVKSIDLAPTLLELAGFPIPKSFQGKSLLPLISKEEGRGDVILSGSQYSGKMSIQEGRWKLVADMRKGRNWLFDLESPEGEAKDLSGEHPGLLSQLLGKLKSTERLNKKLGLEINQEIANIDEEMRGRLRSLGYIE